jgi:hypothetical protein
MEDDAPRDLERDVERLAEIIRALYHKGQDEEEWRADVEETFDELNLDLCADKHHRKDEVIGGMVI